jgi:hypothetical protein
MSRHSFEGGGERICCLAQFADRDEPFPDWPTLPVSVGFGFLFLDICYPANRFVHCSNLLR